MIPVVVLGEYLVRGTASIGENTDRPLPPAPATTMVDDDPTVNEVLQSLNDDDFCEGKFLSGIHSLWQ